MADENSFGIIFWVETVFNQRDFERYGIKNIKCRNVSVEVWDLSAFLFPEYHRLNKHTIITGLSELKIFYSLNDILTAIDQLPDNIAIISVVNFTIQTWPVYRALSKSKATLGLLSNNAVPPQYNTGGFARNISNKLRGKISLSRIQRAIFRRTPIRFLDTNAADFVIAGGTRSLDNGINKYSQLINAESEILWAHTMDYDKYLSDSKAQRESNTGVFIDQNFYFHPDRLRKKSLSFQIDIDEYFGYLNEFFLFLEKEMGIQIVIASHPKSNDEEMRKCFGSRKIVRGMTAELVKESLFVITHYSTAVNFAVLYKKPVLFITTTAFEQTFRHGYIKIMSSLLNNQIINIDNLSSLNVNEYLKVDRSAYEEYKLAYIKRNDSPLKNLWEIVVEYLLEKIPQYS